MVVRNYRELVIWQKSMDLVELVYKLTASFPKEEVFGLKSQLRRAAISIPSNIAEGQGRRTTREFLQFLSIGNGSLREVETQTDIALRLNYISQPQYAQLVDLANEISRLYHGLRASLERKSK
jgi:four helix bundle protein